uniref:Peptidase A1 domain-containing protein n=1 Tax=Pyrodinium bahamense TaxID=73915 RepID=A0A7S0FBP3_9DINO
MPHDGVLGLSLEGLSGAPLSSFFERLMDSASGLLPHFAITLGATEGSIMFGGHDRTRLAAPIRWFPVSHPDMGFWQVPILAVRIGNVTVDPCRGGCHGVIDTGSSSVGAQADRLGMLLPSLRSAAPAATGACLGPELVFDLAGMSLVLTAKDYTGASCKPKIGSIHLDGPEFAGFYALGTTLLRNYYTAFDWTRARVGFAPIKASASQGTMDQQRSDPVEKIVV